MPKTAVLPIWSVSRRLLGSIFERLKSALINAVSPIWRLQRHAVPLILSVSRSVFEKSKSALINAVSLIWRLQRHAVSPIWRLQRHAVSPILSVSRRLLGSIFERPKSALINALPHILVFTILVSPIAISDYLSLDKMNSTRE
jgi:hypothetical protein